MGNFHPSASEGFLFLETDMKLYEAVGFFEAMEKHSVSPDMIEAARIAIKCIQVVIMQRAEDVYYPGIDIDNER